MAIPAKKILDLYYNVRSGKELDRYRNRAIREENASETKQQREERLKQEVYNDGYEAGRHDDRKEIIAMIEAVFE